MPSSTTPPRASMSCCRRCSPAPTARGRRDSLIVPVAPPPPAVCLPLLLPSPRQRRLPDAGGGRRMGALQPDGEHSRSRTGRPRAVRAHGAPHPRRGTGRRSLRSAPRGDRVRSGEGGGRGRPRPRQHRRLAEPIEHLYPRGAGGGGPGLRESRHDRTRASGRPARAHLAGHGLGDLRGPDCADRGAGAGRSALYAGAWRCVFHGGRVVHPGRGERGSHPHQAGGAHARARHARHRLLRGRLHLESPRAPRHHVPRSLRGAPGGATALLPVYARDILGTGPVGLGVLRSAPAVGALATSIFLAHYPLERRIGPTLFRSVIVYGIATCVFGISTNFVLSILALSVLGAADVVSVVIRVSLAQIRTPDPLRGRVSAVHSLFTGTSNQLGAFESGLAAAFLGTVPAVLLGGVGTIAVASLWLVFFPELWRLGRFEE